MYIYDLTVTRTVHPLGMGRYTQSSGVSIVATIMQISSAKDKNPVFCELCFYGIIIEI